MANKKYIVTLTSDERELLRELVDTGKTQAYRIKHANILLKADREQEAWNDLQIAQAFGCHQNTVANVRLRFVLQGLETALERQQRKTPPVEPILDGAGEARLTQLACSTPPEGRADWTLELLADQCVVLKIADSISPQTVMRTLKKTNSSRTVKRAG